MEKFWIIPIIAMIMGASLGGTAIFYKITVVLPSAELELIELQAMKCWEIKEKINNGRFSIPQNGEFARDKLDVCAEIAKQKITKLFKECSDSGGIYIDNKCKSELEIRKLKLQDTMYEASKSLNYYEAKLLSAQQNMTDALTEANEIMELDGRYKHHSFTDGQ